MARDKLARWNQLKYVSSFNEDFQKILLGIPTITVEEQLDRYAGDLKIYIWKELCTKEYSSLSELLRDAERIAMALRRFGKSAPKFGNPVQTPTTKANEPVPIVIGNLQLKKLTAAERDQCRKERTLFPLPWEGAHG